MAAEEDVDLAEVLAYLLRRWGTPGSEPVTDLIHTLIIEPDYRPGSEPEDGVLGLKLGLTPTLLLSSSSLLLLM